jgi:methylthioribose-1-phosphate isomerase
MQILSRVVPLRWVDDARRGHIEMLDQTRLPHEEIWHRMSTVEEVARGIREMVIRGAPAIGIAAAYGVVLGMRELGSENTTTEEVDAIFEQLAHTRPTAVNLFWALRRMRRRVEDDVSLDELFIEAKSIEDEDRINNLTLSRHGASLFGQDVNILTHCNTGGLATARYGTALGVVRALHAQGKLERLWIDETRPYLQGARLTAWECIEDEIPATLVTDSMAGFMMKQELVDAVIVGCDRVAANGDVANKIGTYSLAVLCSYHKIPFYVAAPLSTLDLQTMSGDQIEIEQRAAIEITHLDGHPVAPSEIDVFHPAFDVTPHGLVTAFITERGIVKAPFEVGLQEVLGLG